MSKYYKAEDVIRCVAQYIMTDAKIDNSYVCGDIEDYIEFTEAILADLPTIEVSEDCISREWVLEEYQKGEEKIGKSEFFAELMWLVKHAPSVVPSRTEGEWINQEQGAFYPVECSNCHKQPLLNEDEDYEYTKYCPYCGAKMKV